VNLIHGDRTPMLDQYSAIKRKYADAILFYRMGDFYEMFYDDAVAASEILGLRLTSRAHGKGGSVPLAGFPYHQLDNYLTRMVEAGRRVVIVEQIEDPKKAKGLVKRDVVKVVTSGTNPALVDRDDLAAARIAALIKSGDKWGVAWADIGSGEFEAGEFECGQVKALMDNVAPLELVIPAGTSDLSSHSEGGKSPTISKLEEWIWEVSFARRTLLDHFSTVGLKGFGIEELPLAVSAAGALLYYLKGNLRVEPSHITCLSRAVPGGKMAMEPAAVRNLELVASLSGDPRATLFAVIDRTVTPAGRKLLYNRLLEPLTDRNLIEERLAAVAELHSRNDVRQKLRALLKSAGDIRRILARLVTGRASARDLTALRDALGKIPDLQRTAALLEAPLLQGTVSRMDALPQLKERLDAALLDDPPLAITEGGMIRNGFDSAVDELREIRSGGRNWLENYERRERETTGIGNLKIGYNKIFNYFIEVTKSQFDKVPNRYIRRQTLVNAERFTTPELQAYEEKLISADERLCELESELFTQLVAETLKFAPSLQETAQALAEFDFFAALATLAEDENYSRPLVTDDDRLSLEGSRHPVVEKLLPPGESFVPNDIVIGGDGARILIVTGPNMAGKSTYLRQIGLAVILAQMGSFVPACRAEIGVVDKLFTRIGALDNLAGGESTFLVEMQETASILRNVTSRSLVLFDEVGRGTSTFDGLSLAWAIVEYLHETPRLKPRTLFATHFHEMVDLENYLLQVKNLNVAVREHGDKVIFLRKIIPGGSDRSFGIHVAQMAGIPAEVTARAREVLANLEANDLSPTDRNGAEEREKARIGERVKAAAAALAPRKHSAQLSFFDPVESRLKERLVSVDPDSLTPLEALKLIVELKKLISD